MSDKIGWLLTIKKCKFISILIVKELLFFIKYRYSLKNIDILEVELELCNNAIYYESYHKNTVWKCN